jgi:proteasome lid subunit RPN8/RPN11
MNISPELLQEVVDHALEDPLNEVCGFVAVEPKSAHPKVATRVYRATNIHASPLKFEIDAMEQYKLNQAIEQKGWEVGGIYHSHVRSPPKPSQTDITFAARAGSIEWIIVGLAAGQEPDVRSYLINDGQVEEVPLAEQAA